MSRDAAGAAIRRLREARDWSLADLASATGVSIMGLSYLERGVRKPHKSTVQKVENGLGLPPGSYARLVAADDPQAELAQLTALTGADGPPAGVASRSSATPLVERHTDADVLEGYAEAQLDMLHSLMDRLPPNTSDEYETYIRSMITRCVQAELLAAQSWRVCVNAGTERRGRLMRHVTALEQTRTDLLQRMGASLGSRFDRACGRSMLPEPVIAELVGVSADDIWTIRNRGVVSPDVVAQVRAFADAFADADAFAEVSAVDAGDDAAPAGELADQEPPDDRR